jgi:hypothetical protein
MHFRLLLLSKYSLSVSPKCSYARNLFPKVVMLKTEENFKRRGLVEGHFG